MRSRKSVISIGGILLACWLFPWGNVSGQDNSGDNPKNQTNTYAYLHSSGMPDSIKLARFMASFERNNSTEYGTQFEEKNITTALQIAKDLENHADYLFLLNELCFVKRKRGDFKEVDSLAYLIVSYSRKYSIENVLYDAYAHLAHIIKREWELDSTLAYAENSLDVAERHDNTDQKIRANNHISSIYHRLDEIYLTLTHLFKALELAQNGDNIEQISRLNTRIGRIYMSVDDYKKALKHRQQALKYANLSGDSTITAQAQHRLGDSYFATGEDGKALELYFKALDYRRRHQPVNKIGQVLFSISVVYNSNEEYDCAKSYLEEALDIFNTMNHDSMTARINALLGEIYLKKERLDSAKQYYQESLELSENKEWFRTIEISYNGLKTIAEKQGDFEEAYRYQSLRKVAADSILMEQRNGDVGYAEAEFRANFEQQQQAAEYAQTLTLKNHQIEYLNTLITGFILFSVLISGLLFLLYRSRNDQKESLAIIQVQNRKINQKNEKLNELNEVKNKYFTILAHDLRAPFGTILQLAEVINRNTPDNESRDFREATELLENSSKQFNNLLENIFEWGRLQMNGVQIHKESLNLSEETDKTLQFLVSSAAMKKLTLQNNILEHLEVHSDKNILQGVINNLVSNAIKFTQKGGKVDLVAEKTSESHARVSITDNGIGMSSNQLEAVFKLNKHNYNGSTDSVRANGFGLINSKKMIELNGGELFIESKKGKGTTISFTLQLANR